MVTVAHLAEHRVVVAGVVGSIPTSHPLGAGSCPGKAVKGFESHLLLYETTSKEIMMDETYKAAMKKEGDMHAERDKGIPLLAVTEGGDYTHVVVTEEGRVLLDTPPIPFTPDMPGVWNKLKYPGDDPAPTVGAGARFIPLNPGCGTCLHWVPEPRYGDKCPNCGAEWIKHGR